MILNVSSFLNVSRGRLGYGLRSTSSAVASALTEFRRNSPASTSVALHVLSAKRAPRTLRDRRRPTARGDDEKSDEQRQHRRSRQPQLVLEGGVRAGAMRLPAGGARTCVGRRARGRTQGFREQTRAP